MCVPITAFLESYTNLVFARSFLTPPPAVGFTASLHVRVENMVQLTLAGVCKVDGKGSYNTEDSCLSSEALPRWA